MGDDAGGDRRMNATELRVYKAYWMRRHRILRRLWDALVVLDIDKKVHGW